MYIRLRKLLESIRSNFWFVPGMLMSAATIVSVLLIYADWHIDTPLEKQFPFLRMSASSAQSILSSIVGATVTSTGVVFSMTIVALSLASSQFGSRLIRTFRKRRSTHFTLGIFVATSLYCVLVLASIREYNDFDFVPKLAVAFAIVLTVVCLSTLVYYIHDMSFAIQADSVIERSADDLYASISMLYPERIGDEKDQSEIPSDRHKENSGQKHQVNGQVGDNLFAVTWQDENAIRAGYIQSVDVDSIMGYAEQFSLVIRLEKRPGDFIHSSSTIATIHRNLNTADEGESSDTDDLEQEVAAGLRATLIVGDHRTPLQDVRYSFNELTEIAVRALSPGINDPFTAITCVDRIYGALLYFHRRSTPSAFRYDSDGVLRVVAFPVTFADCLDHSLRVIDHYAKDSPLVRARVTEVLAKLKDQVGQSMLAPDEHAAL